MSSNIKILHIEYIHLQIKIRYVKSDVANRFGVQTIRLKDWV